MAQKWFVTSTDGLLQEIGRELHETERSKERRLKDRPTRRPILDGMETMARPRFTRFLWPAY